MRLFILETSQVVIAQAVSCDTGYFPFRSVLDRRLYLNVNDKAPRATLLQQVLVKDLEVESRTYCVAKVDSGVTSTCDGAWCTGNYAIFLSLFTY